jgi:hypothetical protein
MNSSTFWLEGPPLTSVDLSVAAGTKSDDSEAEYPRSETFAEQGVLVRTWWEEERDRCRPRA